MNYPPYIFTCFLLLGMISCSSEQSSSPIDKVSSHSPSVQSETSIDLHAFLTEQAFDTIEVDISYDHSFHQAKRYRSIPFIPVMEKLVATHQIDVDNAEVRLICKDGYIPSLTVASILERGGGYLAFKDIDAPNGQLWDENRQDKFTPLYLVWEDLPKEDHSMSWPFGLVALEFVSLDSSINRIKPVDASPEISQGFALYQENCLKCHAINAIGGNMGPEFNSPKNITTYWKREDIVAFAQAPSSYRQNSKMPAVEHVSESELGLIVDYLVYMAGR